MTVDEICLLRGWVERIRQQDTPQHLEGIQAAIADATEHALAEIERLRGFCLRAHLALCGKKYDPDFMSALGNEAKDVAEVLGGAGGS